MMRAEEMKLGSLGAFCRRFLAGCGDLLREIADQNAYSRHLAEHGVAHSGDEWRRFSDERFRAKYQRAKCC
jgi:hypothetical protein